MKSTTSRTKRKFLLFLLAGLLVLGAGAYAFYYFQYKRKQDYVFVQVRAFQTAAGWGYEVLTDGKVYIKQDFIPAIAGKHGFATKEKALLVGNAVVSKIEHRQLPVISFGELKAMHIIDDSLHAY
jgi:hypothetical protein